MKIVLDDVLEICKYEYGRELSIDDNRIKQEPLIHMSKEPDTTKEETVAIGRLFSDSQYNNVPDEKLIENKMNKDWYERKVYGVILNSDIR